MSELRRLPSRLDGIEEYEYTSHSGRSRRVRRVALCEPVVWRECTGDVGFVGIVVVFVNSSASDAMHYERLRRAASGPAGLAPC